MISITKQELRALKNGEISVEDYANKLLDEYPVKQLALTLAEMIADYDEGTRITVSQEEFDRIVGLFKVRGINALTGAAEMRGRPKSTSK